MAQESSQQQIWQRVFSQQPTKREDIRPLLLSAAESAAVFHHLANTLTGTARDRAKVLYQSQGETVACLKGLAILSGDPGENLKRLQPSKEPPRRLLEKAYHRAKRAVAEYAARSLDGEFGMVFRCLSQQEEQRCAEIARLLGTVSQTR